MSETSLLNSVIRAFFAKKFFTRKGTISLKTKIISSLAARGQRPSAIALRQFSDATAMAQGRNISLCLGGPHDRPGCAGSDESEGDNSFPNARYHARPIPCGRRFTRGRSANGRASNNA
jgi:hypothetical protein